MQRQWPIKNSAASRLVCLSAVCRFSPSAATDVVYFMSRSFCLFFRTWCYFYSISAPSFIHLQWLTVKLTLVTASFDYPYLLCKIYLFASFSLPCIIVSCNHSPLLPNHLFPLNCGKENKKNEISDGLGWWWDPAWAVKLQNLYPPSFRVIINITASA